MIIEFIDLKELCRRMCISRGSYYDITNVKHEKHDSSFPVPVTVFTSTKLRFSSIDVDAYIKAHSHSV